MPILIRYASVICNVPSLNNPMCGSIQASMDDKDRNKWITDVARMGIDVIDAYDGA